MYKTYITGQIETWDYAVNGMQELDAEIRKGTVRVDDRGFVHLKSSLLQSCKQVIDYPARTRED